jgi:hypothetical protein
MSGLDVAEGARLRGLWRRAIQTLQTARFLKSQNLFEHTVCHAV